MRNRKTVILIALILGSFVRQASAATTTYFVNKSTGSPSNDGLSWATAFDSISTAIAAAEETDSIWIAGGESPSPQVYVEAFTAIDRVQILGGFAPTGDPGLNERNPSRYLTILSADINGDDTANFGHRIDNYGILISVPANASSNTLISGLIVRGATQHAIDNGATSRAQFTQLVVMDNGELDPTFDGAGFNNGGSLARPTLRDCQFQGNRARNGGALSNPYGSLFLIDGCSFVENTAYGGDGGAIVSSSRAITIAGEKPIIRRSRFVGNQAKVHSAGGYGGAIRLNGKIWALSSEFHNNVAEAEGGALYFTFSNVFLADLLFDGNICEGNGGAIGGYRGCKLASINCLYYDNDAGSDGAAIYATEMARVNILNNTVTRNIGNTTGGIYVVADQDDDCAPGEEEVDPEGIPLEPSLDPAEPAVTPFVKVRNSILYGNACRNTPTCTSFERELNITASGTTIVDFNDLFDLASSPYDTGGDSNIDANPQFRDPSFDNFRLVEASPCLDIGNSRILPYDEEDIDGDARTVCTGCSNNVGEYAPDLDLRRRVVDTATAADGSKSALSCFTECDEVVDLGAYEFACPINCGPNGDLNDDGNVNGLDIQPFTWCAVRAEDGSIPCLCADFSGPNDGMPDGQVDIYDIPCFVQLLLTGSTSCSGPLPCDAPAPEIVDCNENDIPDANDIAFGTSLDCNKNGVPDECDISSESSADVNSNDIPDECETDCDGDTIPDAWAIAEELVADINANGVPDACDPDCDHDDQPDDYEIAHGAADCNANSVPDSCEIAIDCNSNGVPDDCDIDPLDPDGNESVSEDCNGNGIPDECDLSRSILHSFDCNDNNVPDECDIANETSEDANENGIPDECEESHRGGSEGGGEFNEAAAWELFYEWYEEQVNGTPGDWGTLSGPDRFERVMDELELLGLPYARPW